MTPLSAVMLFIMSILSFIVLLFQLPGLLIGLLVAPISRRGNWFVEFLYPFGLAKWGHLKLMQWGASTKNGVTLGNSEHLLHSRCIEQRTEVVKGRVYIHPLPQLLDNIGYLIVCVPPLNALRNSKKSIQKPPILAIVVDCGDANSVVEQIDLIESVHYSHLGCKIEIHALLCTHKHHDHTAGNKDLLNHEYYGKTLKKIYGGAIERVPYCNSFVSDGTIIKLPSASGNNMNRVVSIECLATPSHTRGSIVYTLSNKPLTKNASFDHNDELAYSYLFTGDTMFSGGGGVPFEADLEFPKNRNVEQKTSTSSFKPTAGLLSLERCYAEILRRAIDNSDLLSSPNGKPVGATQMIIFPGHEYTLDLLQRQFQPDSIQMSNYTWNRHQPSVFFELATQFFVTGHRRHLPRSTRILAAPSSMKRELQINPYYRSLKKRAEHILTSISVWYKYSERNRKISSPNHSDAAYLTLPRSFSFNQENIETSYVLKSPSSETSWNVNHVDLNKSIFTTVYSDDLEIIINSLKSGTMDKSTAARKLSELSDRLDEPTVQRRPVPNTFPSEKKMYLGLLAMAVLGSQPSGLTAADSTKMNLANPVDASDYLLISKSKLISSLFRLGLFLNCATTSDLGNNDLVQMIDILWDEARVGFQDLRLHDEGSDLEVQNEDNDLLELGALKLELYAVPYNKPSWFSKFCMPCNSNNRKTLFRAQQSESKANKMKKKKLSGGELVRHDITNCPMCSSVIGCPRHVEAKKKKKSPMKVHIVKGSPPKQHASKQNEPGIEMTASDHYL
jgi:glyoxylase-like metal-dependent hydrolase (beta-lactamase superfamily II)